MAPPTRAEVRRRARTSTLKSVTRMVNMYNKKHGVNVRQFKEGDFVTVAIPKADRTATAMSGD